MRRRNAGVGQLLIVICICMSRAGMGKTTFIKNLFASYTKDADFPVASASDPTSRQVSDWPHLDICVHVRWGHGWSLCTAALMASQTLSLPLPHCHLLSQNSDAAAAVIEAVRLSLLYVRSLTTPVFSGTRSPR